MKTKKGSFVIILLILLSLLFSTVSVCTTDKGVHNNTNETEYSVKLSKSEAIIIGLSMGTLLSGILMSGIVLFKK